jgi:hypothetical protein
MAVMYAAFEELTVALKEHKREAVHDAARGFVAAWSRSHLLLGEFLTPNDEARDAVRSALRALHVAGEVVDLLFADALARAPCDVQQFVTDARANVAAALERDRGTTDDPEPR